MKAQRKMTPPTAHAPLRRTVPVRTRILVPVCLMLALQMAVLLGGMIISRMIPNLNIEAMNVLTERTQSRKNYLQSEMLTRWANVDAAVMEVNALYARMQAESAVRGADLSTDAQQYTAFLASAGDALVSAMRANSTTGAFLVLDDANSSGVMLANAASKAGDKDAAQGARAGKYPMLYLRDLDPVSRYNAQNGDLLLEYAPMDVVSSLGISTDTNWRPLFVAEEDGVFAEYLQELCRVAAERTDLHYRDMGRWFGPYCLAGGSGQDEAIAYAVPLIAEDGTLYGALGVEMLLTELRERLPYDEMGVGTQGVYLLGIQDGKATPQDGALTFDTVLASGASVSPKRQFDGTFTLAPRERILGGYSLTVPDKQNICATVQPLTLYNSNTPFSNEVWTLVSLMPREALFSTSAQLLATFMLTLAFMLCSSLFAVALLVRVVSRPVLALDEQVRTARKTEPIVLGRTQVREIDALASAIEDLSGELYRSASKFTEIVEMSSTHMGGFEVNDAEKTLFVNHGFFTTFGLQNMDAAHMTLVEFGALFDVLKPFLIEKTAQPETECNEYLFRLPGAQVGETPAGTLWVRLRVLNRAPVWVGLVEDVTREQIEKNKLAYERDHDVLTGLYNRRAFERLMETLFRSGRETLQCAALLMLDLDNLKYVNDTYGHDMGDEYIHAAAAVLRAHTDGKTLLARISGDEFLMFLYGFEERSALELRLTTLQNDFRAAGIPLPRIGANVQGVHPLRASGGVAWYPTDSLSFPELKRYADFAMYKVKNSIKGEFCNFDLGTYQRDAYLLQSKEALNELLEQNLVDYHFQPIVDARTGEIYAYEALMRSRMEGLTSPDAVLRLARQESKLALVERMTWFCAVEAFAAHRATGAIAPGCRLFLNSISNQALSADDAAALERRFGACLPLVVQEHTEEEQTDVKCQTIKAAYLEKWGAQTALDDYGSGYNGDKLLLSYTPDYIKLDRCLISEIDEAPYKQQMVQGVLVLARTRGIRVIAEGVETRAELDMLIGMGIDYLQGYYLAHPALLPPTVAPERVREIERAAAT